MKKRIEDLLCELSQPILEKHGFYFVDSEYKKEGADWYLRLFIDKDGGITVNDCQLVSEELSSKLDEADPIEHSYIFEVSSPGIERPLKKDIDFKRHLDKLVEVKFYKPFQNNKIIKGKLLNYNDENISIEYSGETLVINKTLIAIIKPSFSFKGKEGK